MSSDTASNAEAGLPSGIDRRQFCTVCGRYATGVAVATVRDGRGDPHGITVNSFTSVSIAPPLVLICVDHRARVLEHFRPGAPFGINVLNETQREISDYFASAKRDRFDGVDWHAGATGAPLVPHAVAFLECKVHKRVAAGDHDIVIGEVLEARIAEGRPLVYYASGYRKLDPGA